MKSTILIFTIIAAFSLVAAAQKTATTFPGIGPAQKMQLDGAKEARMTFAMPTWLPKGFVLEKVEMKLGDSIPVYEHVFLMIYSNKMADGGVQRFAIEAGFDGLGDLMYEPTKTLKTGVGEVILVYEPKDEDGNIEKGYVMTEWFKVGRTDYHYIGMYGFDEEVQKWARMISMDDTVKILTSLKRY